MDGEVFSLNAKSQIFSAVSELLGVEPTTSDALVAWCQMAEGVKKLMMQDHGDLQIPHELWHYLDDADVRMRDSRYAAFQVERARLILSAWWQLDVTDHCCTGLKSSTLDPL